MNKYYIEHEIITLLKNQYFDKNGKVHYSFKVDGIEFSQWDYNDYQGCIGNKWIARGYVDGESGIEALNTFRSKLQKNTSKISFIGQAYIDFSYSSFLVQKDKRFIFRYSKEINAVGLHFQKKQIEALNILTKSNLVPEEFFFYWKEASNTTGYVGKLLCIFSAIDSLDKKDRKKARIQIFGEDFSEKLYLKNKGIRHILVHGDFLENKDIISYEEIHFKIIDFFNKNYFTNELINKEIKFPQRHPFGNLKSWNGIYENISGEKISLKFFIEYLEKNNMEYLHQEKFSLLGSKEIESF